MMYERPAQLTLLTDEQLEALHQKDIAKQEKDNAEHDYDYPNSMETYTRKWYSRMSDASYDWKLLQQISLNDLYEVIHWLSVEDEPCNPKGFGRPGKIKELARDIKYAMSSKQRAVAYNIIAKRFDTNI